MNLLFAHDHKFEIDSTGKIYSEKFPYDVWKPYLKFFDKITVVGRYRSIEKSSKSIAVGLNVTLAPLPSLSSIYGLICGRQKVRQVLTANVCEADAIIVRLPSEIGLYTFQLAKQLNKPLLVEMVGCPWDSIWNYGNLSGMLYAPFAFLRHRLAIRKASHVAYVTKEYLQQRYPSPGKTVSISNVKIPLVPVTVLERRLLKLFPQEESLKIGLIGNLLHYKGIRTLLEAGAILRRHVKPFRLLFLGGGDQRPWVLESIKLGVHDICDFVGTIPPGKPIFDWLDSIDIYVQPSLTEGTPRATLEAMSRGCPVIATKVGGIPDIIQEDKLCCPKDSRRLASLITRVVNDSQWRNEASIWNFNKAKEYSETLLDARRERFLDEFVSHVKKS